MNFLIQNQHSNDIRREIIVGSRRFSNYWWASIILLGGIGFLLTGISAYLNFNILPLINAENIVFFPQGLVMCFYGLLGCLFSIYIWFTIFWAVGEGFNEFNKKKGKVRIFRWGFPGKNRRIELCYPLTQIQSLRVEIKEGLNPKRTIYLKIKGNREIPLTRVGQPPSLEEIERQAADLAKFLQVPIEGL